MSVKAGRGLVLFVVAAVVSLGLQSTAHAGVPGAPTGLTLTPGNTQMGLAWTAPASDGGGGGIAAVAACPNVVIKLGGMGMPSNGFDWHTRDKPIGSEELAEAMAPYMNYCIEQFGPKRSMFESNFPVDKVSFSYNIMYNAFKRLSKDYSASERAAMLHDTAARVYKIDV